MGGGSCAANEVRVVEWGAFTQLPPLFELGLDLWMVEQFATPLLRAVSTS
jgi:hypothetical protein